MNTLEEFKKNKNLDEHIFMFIAGKKGTLEHDEDRPIYVKANSYKECWKKLHRYFDDMYEMKGRELKAIVHLKSGRTDFEFCGRTITVYEIQG